jgi:hypothetical protein
MYHKVILFFRIIDYRTIGIFPPKVEASRPPKTDTHVRYAGRTAILRPPRVTRTDSYDDIIHTNPTPLNRE